MANLRPLSPVFHLLAIFLILVLFVQVVVILLPEKWQKWMTQLMFGRKPQ